MQEYEMVCGGATDAVAGPVEDMAKVLHELCQPLTTLQCRLEIAELAATAEAHREAVTLGLVECARLIECVAQMREIIVSAREAGRMSWRRCG